MSNLIDLILPYYDNHNDFKYFREILLMNEPYKIKFSVDFTKLTEFEKTLNAFRIAVEHYIENEMLNKNTTDKTQYDSILTEFNNITIEKGYRPFYKVISVQTNYNHLKRFPSPYFKGHSNRGDNFYPIYDFLPVNDWVTPRYYRPRMYYHNPVTIYPKPKEWPYWSPVPPPPKLRIIIPSTTQLTETNQPVNLTDEIDKITIDSIRPNGKFQLDNKMVHLTYSYQPDLPTLLTHLNKIIDETGNKIETYSLVHENGNHKPTNQPHPHTHVALKFNKPLRTIKQYFFDYSCPLNPPSDPNFKHPHIRPVKYKNHWNTICNDYHRKETEPLSNYIPSTNQPNLENNQPTYNIHEAVAIFKDEGENGIANYINRIRPNDISRVDSICRTVKNYIRNENENKNKQFNIESSNIELNDWHKHILNFEIPNNDDRILLWVYDLVGNEQKTTFANYMQHHHQAVVITVTSSKNALCQLADESDKRNGDPINVVIFDIPRSAKNIEELYETIELVKNGNFTSEKYKTRSINLGCKPVVLVLSNAYPQIKKCSIDRWKILTLNNGSVEHLFADEIERKKHRKALEILNTSSNDIKPDLINYKEPYHIWPIETFPAAKEYMSIIQEILDAYKIPEIKMEYRPLTEKEKLEKRIMIKSCSEIRTELFKNVDKSIIPFAETTFRCIYAREATKGYIWDVSGINMRDMTPEERNNHDTNKNRILTRQELYEAEKLKQFEENFRKQIASH